MCKAIRKDTALHQHLILVLGRSVASPIEYLPRGAPSEVPTHPPSQTHSSLPTCPCCRTNTFPTTTIEPFLRRHLHIAEPWCEYYIPCQGRHLTPEYMRDQHKESIQCLK